MCGFCGFINKKDKKDILEMNKAIAHRGPDEETYYVDDDIAIGFRRLSIIDLSGGSQPIANEDDSLIIVFNGEIYNFPQLKAELLRLGHIFRTKTDTEVILHGYEEYGTDIVNKLRGMFAFVIWDKNKKELFAARDHFGQKPFYYSNMNGTFLFASEIKSLLFHEDFVKEINRDALKPYLTFQTSVLEECFFKGVYKLLPGHYLVFKYDKQSLDICKYYQVSFEPADQDEEVLAQKIDEVVTSSIDAHTISDVPIGSYLSGGIDSSYVTSYLKPDKSFSVGFDFRDFNEVPYAKGLSDILGIESVSELIDSDDFFDTIEKVQYYADEPTANLSAVPLYFLSDLASRHVKVVLSGEGADEFFGGYPFYQEDPLLLKYRRVVPGFIRKTAKAVVAPLPGFHGKNFLTKGGGRVEDYFVGNAFVFDNREADRILSPKYRSKRTFQSITKPYFDEVKDMDDLTKMQYLDMHFWLPNDILQKADKMSMANSLELRVPFLDKEVFKLAKTVPSKAKLSHGTTKYILRKAAAKRIPEEWYKRPKMGFPVPILQWFREEKYYRKAKDLFNAPFTGEFFDVKKLNKMLDDHYSCKKNNSRKIWTVYTFLVWYEVYFVNFNLQRKN